MFKGILFITAVFLSFSICLPAWPGEPGGPQPAGSSALDTRGERIGGLRLGLHQKEVDKVIPCKVRKGKEALEGASGSHVQMWKYPDCGIELKMGSSRKGGSKTVESIKLHSSPRLSQNAQPGAQSMRTRQVVVGGKRASPISSKPVCN